MTQRVEIVKRIMDSNDRLAQNNRSVLDQHQVFGINIMASPGAGKTSVILETIKRLPADIKLGVIEGDTAPVTIDADKIVAAGIPAVQINTGGDCHLDANMVQRALPAMNLSNLDLLIIENVGNLICPAAFKLGVHFNIVIASVPEGDDKPYKYPGMFRGADVLLLNKMDLQEYMGFNVDYFRQGVEALNPGVTFFPVSCRTGEGLDAWFAWLRAQLESRSAAG